MNEQIQCSDCPYRRNSPVANSAEIVAAIVAGIEQAIGSTPDCQATSDDTAGE